MGKERWALKLSYSRTPLSLELWTMEGQQQQQQRELELCLSNAILVRTERTGDGPKTGDDKGQRERKQTSSCSHKINSIFGFKGTGDRGRMWVMACSIWSLNSEVCRPLVKNMVDYNHQCKSDLQNSKVRNVSKLRTERFHNETLVKLGSSLRLTCWFLAKSINHFAGARLIQVEDALG